jgi:hypothetical protein
MFRSPIFYAVLAFVISSVVIGIILPELACMDGWESPSVGKSGACSHHGGVNRIPVTIGLIVSFVFSFWVWKKFKKNEDKLIDPENKIIDQAEKTSLGILASLNKGACLLWNLLIKALIRIGITKAFDKWPIITVVVSFFAVVIFPPVMAVIFVLGLIAFMNGASAETHYLIPEEK